MTFVATLFVALAVMFVGAALLDFLRSEGKLTPARRAWLMIAFLFSTVSIGLFLLRTLGAQP